jgi:predicted transcriptional regulator of viral defense system
MTPEQFLATHKLFTRGDLQAALRARGSMSPETVTSHLGRWRRLGRIVQVKQGLYVRRDGEGQAAPVVDLLALASRMAPDAALAYHTALEAHGHAQSLFEKLTFVTWTKTKPVRFLGRPFVPVRPRALLARAGRSGDWTEPIDRGGMEVKVTTIERTLVDLFDRPGLSGGLDEVWRSCSSITALDLRELEMYLLLLDRPTLTARVGYFLERRAEELAVSSGLLHRLRQQSPRTRAYMDRRRKSRLAVGWNLMVPEDLVTAEREEVR